MVQAGDLCEDTYHSDYCLVIKEIEPSGPDKSYAVLVVDNTKIIESLTPNDILKASIRAKQIKNESDTKGIDTSLGYLSISVSYNRDLALVMPGAVKIPRILPRL